MGRPIALLWGPEHDLDHRLQSVEAPYALPIHRRAKALAEE